MKTCSIKAIIVNLFLAEFLVFVLYVKAHDEPAMTLRQRKEFLKEHRLYARYGIRTIKVYTVSEHNKRSLLIVEKLSADGLPVEQQFYRADTTWKIVKMFYDQKKNFVMQRTEFAGSSDVHKDVFVFTRKGFVEGGVSFRNDTLIENFSYKHNNDKKSIVFQKTDTLGNTIYLIEFRYRANYHKNDYYWAQKRLSNGTVELTVEKVYDKKGQLIRKNIFRSDGLLSHWFIYSYDHKGKLQSIERHTTEGLQGRTLYQYDKRGLLIEQINTAADGNKTTIWYEYLTE